MLQIMKFALFSFDCNTFCLSSPDVLWSTLFSNTLISSPLLSYLFLLKTPVNISKIQTTENHNPVLLRSWAGPRWLLIQRLANLF
jgi:hypothetical protein